MRVFVARSCARELTSIVLREQEMRDIVDRRVAPSERPVDLTMAYVGTRAMFERAGFTKAADTTSTLAGFPRALMRLELRD